MDKRTNQYEKNVLWLINDAVNHHINADNMIDFLNDGNAITIADYESSLRKLSAPDIAQMTKLFKDCKL